MLLLDTTLRERLRSDAALGSIAGELLLRAGEASEAAAFLPEALRLVLEATRGEYAALTAPDQGRWTPLGEAGHRQPLPVDLLADVLDREAPVSQGSWMAAPAQPRGAGHEVLGVAGAAPSGKVLESLSTLALLCGQALNIVRRREADLWRMRRLESVLEIAGNWYKTREMEPLLVQMAEAATRLLSADRASIFLWDRPNHVLVGRPALGIEGGELRIADDAGVVGQVIQTGQPRRVDVARNQDQIDRRVDQQHGYQTRTLLCVPMRGKSGELFGAFEVLNKRSGNFSDEDEAALTELAAHAVVALENTQERTELLESRRQIAEQAAQGVRLIGQSPAIEALRSTIRRVAATDLAVLILGENGTGKEVVSQSIHYLSSRRDQPFIAVNCAAISETLLESELFGHEKGAFTDARETRQGKFELASGGTLFLDEIGDLSLGGQAKLLRVLEEKVVVRVGGSVPIHTDARVIAATNQNLAQMVRQRKFREDLFFRLNVVSLELPPLRDRPEDIVLLAEHFITDFCSKARRKPLRFSAAAVDRLKRHAWPGNVRELRNLMERLAYLSSGDVVDAGDLAFILTPAAGEAAWTPSETDLSGATAEFQTEHIRRVIAQAGGNITEAAMQLGLHRSNLYRKMRQLGMKIDEPAA
jgi:Nif-specific regulatory protein